MERDFLGISGKDSVSLLKEEARGSRQDSGGSAVQWPFSSKVSSVQQLMTFKAAQEERSKKTAFDQLSASVFQPISTMDAFDANHKLAPAVASQKYPTLDRQVVHQFMMQPYQSQNSDTYGAAKQPASETRAFSVASHHSIPVATNSPFFKIHGSPHVHSVTVSSLKQQSFGGGIAANTPSLGSIVGAFTPRNMSKASPTTAQLTIFYAGSVNVYDNVPLDKAQAIMFLASSGSNSTSTTANPRPETPLSVPSKVAGVDGVSTNQTQTQTPNQVTPACSGLSSPISITSHTAVHSGSGSSKADDVGGAKTVGLSAPACQHESSKTVTTGLGSASTVTLMPRAVPQARKASLARFLEKRKERVTNAMPYSCTKTTEDATGADDMNLCSKASSPEIALSSNMERPWALNQPKNSIVSGGSPSTKLEM